MVFQYESGILVAPENCEAEDPKFKKLRTNEDLRRADGVGKLDCMALAMSRRITERKSLIANRAVAAHGYRMRTNRSKPSKDEAPGHKKGRVICNRYDRSHRELYLEPITGEGELMKEVLKQNKRLERIVNKVSDSLLCLCYIFHYTI